MIMMSQFPTIKQRQYTTQGSSKESKLGYKKRELTDNQLASTSKRVYTSIPTESTHPAKRFYVSSSKPLPILDPSKESKPKKTETANRQYTTSSRTHAEPKVQLFPKANQQLSRQYTTRDKGKGKEISDDIDPKRVHIENLPATLLWLRQKEGTFKCWVKDILNFTTDSSYAEKDLYFYEDRWPVLIVEIHGIIVGVSEGEKNVSYLMDDGTGVINCLQPQLESRTSTMSNLPKTSMNPYIPRKSEKSTSAPHRPPLELFSTARVIGKVITKWEERLIQISTITATLGFDEESSHHLSISSLKRTKYSKPFVLSDWKMTSPQKSLATLPKETEPKKKPRLRIPSKITWEKLQKEHMPVYIMAFLRDTKEGKPTSKIELTSDLELWNLAKRLVQKEILEKELGLQNIPPPTGKGAILSPKQKILSRNFIVTYQPQKENTTSLDGLTPANLNLTTKTTFSTYTGGASDHMELPEVDDKKVISLFNRSIRALLKGGEILESCRMVDGHMEEMWIAKDTE